MSKKPTRALVRRAPQPTENQLLHDEAFAAVHGPQTYRLRQGSLAARSTDEAGERASACIKACDGLDLNGLKQNGIADLVSAARVALRTLSGRLVRIDPETELARQQIQKALRKLGVK